MAIETSLFGGVPMASTSSGAAAAAAASPTGDQQNPSSASKSLPPSSQRLGATVFVRGYLYRDANAPQRGPEDTAYTEFAPIELKQYSDAARYTTVITTFSRAVEHYFLPLEKQRIEEHNDDRKQTKDSKLESFKKNHQRRIEGLADAEAKNRKIADVIVRNADQVNDAIFLMREVLKAKLSWDRLAELLKQRQAEGHPVAQIIHELKLQKNTITLLLFSPFEKQSTVSRPRGADESQETVGQEEKEAEDDDDSDDEEAGETISVDIDITLTAHGNACKYHDSRKATHEKLERTIQATDKAADSAKKKGERTVNHSQSGKAEKRDLVSIRTPFWFEKFHWFVTQAGFLVVLGKDASQTDVILRKYRGPADIFIHCDAYDAQPALLKNPDRTCVPTSSVEEAGLMVVSRSKAWERKSGVATWWVPAFRVSKKGPGGEFLPQGHTHVSGMKHLMKPLPLELGCALIFVGDGFAPRAPSLGSLRQESDSSNELEANNGMRARQSSTDASALVDALIDIAELLPREVLAPPSSQTTSLSSQHPPPPPAVTFALPVATAIGAAGSSASPEQSVASAPTEGGGGGGHSNVATPVTATSAQFPSASAQGMFPSSSNAHEKPRRAGEPKKMSHRALTASSTAGSTTTPEQAAEKLSPSAAGGGSRSSKSGGGGRPSPQPQGGAPSGPPPAKELDKRKLRKLKKIQDKYGEQDDDEREAAMMLLGNKPSNLHAVIAKQQQQALASAAAVPPQTSSTRRPHKGGGAKTGGKKQGSSKALDELVEEELLAQDDDIDQVDDDASDDEDDATAVATAKAEATSSVAADEAADQVTSEHEQLRRRTLSHDEEEERIAQRMLADAEAVKSFVVCPRVQDPAGPNDEGILRFAIFVVAPYFSVRDYRYKIRISPGPIDKKGQALKQIMTVFTNAAAADEKHTFLVKAVSHDEAVQQMVSGVKIHPYVPFTQQLPPSAAAVAPSSSHAAASQQSSERDPPTPAAGARPSSASMRSMRGGMPAKLRGSGAVASSKRGEEQPNSNVAARAIAVA